MTDFWSALPWFVQVPIVSLLWIWVFMSFGGSLVLVLKFFLEVFGRDDA